MTGRRRRKKSSKTSKALDALDTVDSVGTLFELGPVGLAIAVVGGAAAATVGVLKFLDRRSKP